MNTIYVICPSNAASGGPEALHQLCRSLCDLGYDAKMFFPPYDTEKYSSPVCEEYLHYGNPYTMKAVDNANSCFIYPEGMNLKDVLELKYAKKIMWWLSVDNFLGNNKIYERDLINKFLNLYFNYHLVQSEYARRYCIDEVGIPEDKVFYVSDYLNDTYLSKASDNTKKYKKDQVLYNPKKGFEFTKQLIDCAPEIKWIPLIDMTYDQVRDTMQESKVYIDFGNHPGMDRLPREAAINGCCVLTGRRGAAAYHEDVPIPDKYKFDDTSESIPAIINAIKALLENYESSKNDFDDYRNWIICAKERFYSDTKRAFNSILPD